MGKTKKAEGSVVLTEREEIPPVAADQLSALSETELGRRTLRAERSAVATDAAHELLSRASFPRSDVPVPLTGDLTAAQRAAAETTARREHLDLAPFALPRARVTRARWLGLEAPSALEKIVKAEVGGETVSLPLWAARSALGLPWNAEALAPWVSRRELLDVYAEVLLHGGYEGGNVFGHLEVWGLLDEHAADFLPAAEILLGEAKRLWASTDPHASVEQGSRPSSASSATCPTPGRSSPPTPKRAPEGSRPSSHM